jgi:Trk K+ transport system NAD-binding subunit
VTEVRVLEESRLIGLTLAEAHLDDELGLSVLAIVHEGEQVKCIDSETVIHLDDLLIVSGDIQSLIEADSKLGVVIEPDYKIQLADLDTDSAHIFEAVLPSRSQFRGRTVKEVRFRDR